MPDYKTSKFKKPFNKGPRRDFDGPKQLYKAECSNCRQMCEVPFRPNGVKPVFCRNCFNRDRSEDQAPPRRPDAREFPRKEYGARESFAPRATPAAPDRRIDELKHQLTNMEAKLDRLMKLVDSAPATAAVEKAPAKAKAKKVVKKK